MRWSVQKLVCPVYSIAGNNQLHWGKSLVWWGHQSFVRCFSWVQSIIKETSGNLVLALWSGLMYGVRVREWWDKVYRNCSSRLLVSMAWNYVVLCHVFFPLSPFWNEKWPSWECFEILYTENTFISSGKDVFCASFAVLILRKETNYVVDWKSV